MRKTEIPEEGHEHLKSAIFQSHLDAFWNLIEDMYEDEWRVEISGAVVLVVDNAMLERVLTDNIATAWYEFGAFKGGQDAAGNRFWLARPEYLKGLWSIEGIYNAKQAYVGGPRTYSFEKE